MPRLPRVHLNGVLYYVTQQSAQARPLFRDQEDYQTYLDLLSQYKLKHQFKLFAYALNSEKIHLIVEPFGETTISEIMRDLTSRYSKYCNGRYGSNGPLFKGRFHTHLAEKETLLVKLVHFVHSLSSAAVTAGVENSRVLFSAGQAGAAASLKNSMKLEFAELAEQLQGMGFLGGIELLANPMSGEKKDVILKMLKDPVMGSPKFVEKVRAEIDGAVSLGRKEKNAPDLRMDEPLAVGGGHSKWFGKVGVFAFACAMLVPALFFVNMKTSTKSPVAKQVTSTVSAQTSPETVAHDRNTLHASVIVLEGTEWNLRLIPSGNADKSSVEFDKISFADDQVFSKKMAAKGFQPTNYTMTTNPDGTIVWETIQTGPSGEKVFWRGEWKEDGMRGVISQQDIGGELKTFQFMGSR